MSFVTYTCIISQKFAGVCLFLYLCSIHFDKSKTKVDNNMNGRFAQNLSKSFRKSIIN